MDQIRAVNIISHPIGASKTFWWGANVGVFCGPVHVKSVLLLPSLWLGKPYLQNNTESNQLAMAANLYASRVFIC